MIFSSSATRSSRLVWEKVSNARLAADAGYKRWGVWVARCLCRPCESRDPYAVSCLEPRWQISPSTTTALVMGPCFRRDDRLHRHLPVPHRRTNRKTFRRIDDGVGVDAVVAVEVANAAGLAKMLDAKRLDAVAAHAAEPAQRGRVAVDHGHDAAIAGERRQQPFDMAEMLH